MIDTLAVRIIYFRELKFDVQHDAELHEVGGPAKD
ncbi:hypothetical protein DVH24_042714 [Malus domestica]|uniref:Uncharacterized protein n=1 Tax=Malus domestica TaxID=3750 RepID=A0A498I1Z5_MALDO|nr:hypothetical protein DVH24_042714 [Malus domestica]